MESLDLNSIKKTELLTSIAAKDKIMIKPKRTSTRQSRRKSSVSFPARLLSLNEETGSKPDIINENKETESSGPGSLVKVALSEEAPPSSKLSSDNMTADANSSLSASKLTLSFSTTTSSENKGDILLTTLPPTATTTTALTASSPLSPTSPNANYPTLKSGDVAITETRNQPAFSSPTSSPADAVTTTDDDKKINNSLSSNNKINIVIVSDVTMETPPVNKISQTQKELDEIKSATVIKSRMNQFQTPAVTCNKFSSSGIPGRLPLKLTSFESSTEIPAKDDNKARQWGQSKIKTMTKETPSTQSGQKVNFYNTQTSYVSPTKPLESSVDKSTPSPTTAVNAGVKKMENIQCVSADSPTSSVVNGPWMNIARKNKNNTEITEEDITKSSKVVNFVSNISADAPTSVLTSASNVEEKQEQPEKIINKKTKWPDQMTKKEDKFESKCHSGTDMNSSNLPKWNPNSTKVGSSDTENSIQEPRKESISDSKTYNQKAYVSTTLPGNRFKSFSGASSTSKTKGLNLTSNTSLCPADGDTSSITDVKPVPTVDGANQIQQGNGISVKILENSATLPKRGMNSRTYTSSAATTTFNILSGAASSSLPNKSDTPSACSSESSGASSSSSSSTLPTGHVSKLAATQSSFNLPSQPPLVTSPTSALNVKSIFAECNSKTPPYSALAPKSAGFSTQLISKPATTCAPIIATCNTFNTKPASTAVGQTFTKFSGIKPFASASNISSSVTSTTSDVLLQTPSTTSTTSTSSSFAKSYSSSSSSVAFKPPISSTASSSSVAFKPPITTTSSSSSSSSSKFTSSNALQTSVNSTEKSAPTTDKTMDTKTEQTAKIPIWRANLKGKEVNIDIVDKSSTKPPQQPSSQTSLKVLKMSKETDTNSETSKKTETMPSPEIILQVKISSGKASKVLDIVKNFQNCQVPS